MSRDDPKSRMLAGSHLGAIRGGNSRRAERQAGLAFAKAWKLRPRPAFGGLPFDDHRTCAEWE